MEIFGLTIARTRNLPELIQKRFPAGPLQSVDSRGGWWSIVRESFAGAWQRNVEVTTESVLSFGAVFACLKLIAGDIAKMDLGIQEFDETSNVWKEVEVSAFSPVLRKPNRYQTRIQFIQGWIYSKLIHGNTYVLLQRNQRATVSGMYMLDPLRVRPLVAPDGAVFYELKKDFLSNLETDMTIVPASEIMHDRTEFFFHPLVGLSPIYAAGLGALQGLRIQNNSTVFFGNGATPGGVLTAPGAISQETADRVKAKWEGEFGGVENAGKIAVLGDGLKYEAMTMKSTDAQLIEQLKWTAENVCMCFGVPPYMIGVGSAPNYNNVEALNQQYYSQCLQILMESMKLVMIEGFGLLDKIGGRRLKIEFDLDDLLKMDSSTMMQTLENGRNYLTPNEGRQKLNLPPKEGGDVVLRQQQDFSLAALNRRDTQQAAPNSSADAATAPPPVGGGPTPSAQVASAPAKGALPTEPHLLKLVAKSEATKDHESRQRVA